MKILLIYELENREYDNALLLATELERRGHTVDVKHKATCFILFKRYDILIIPNCYNDENYNLYTFMTNSNNIPIINLQYEQVLSIAGEERGYHNPKGKARQVLHICWGEASYARLIESGVSPEQLVVNGAIHLDFLRDQFRNFYYSKAKIAEKSKIDIDKKWLLYISSFTMARDDVQPFADDTLNDNNTLKFIEISRKSREDTFSWFEEIINTVDEVIILYRLHPAEREDKFIKDFQNQYPKRFIVIEEYSVKQWIVVSDMVFTWFSTSIVESYFAQKNCYILRPFDIPKDIDSVIYDNSVVINNVDDMKKLIIKENYVFSSERFSIDFRQISKYYDQKSNIFTFIRVADSIEGYSKREIIPSNNLMFALRRLIFTFTKPFVIKSILEELYFKISKYKIVKLSRFSPYKKVHLNKIEKKAQNSKSWGELNNIKKNKLTQIIMDFEIDFKKFALEEDRGHE